MREIIDIGYTEFFDVEDKVCLGHKCGVVMKTYELDQDNCIIGGELIVCWDTKVECDFQIIPKDMEDYLFKIEPEYEFTYINDDGTTKDN